MNKQELLNWIKNADISQDDWHVDIPQHLPSDFARNYYKAKMERIGDTLCSDEEDYRSEVYALVKLIA